MCRERAIIVRKAQKYLEEQKDYIEKVIALQTMIANMLEVNIFENVLDSLLERFGKVY